MDLRGEEIVFPRGVRGGILSNVFLAIDLVTKECTSCGEVCNIPIGLDICDLCTDELCCDEDEDTE